MKSARVNLALINRISAFHDVSGKRFKIRIRTIDHFACTGIFCIGLIGTLLSLTVVSVFDMEITENENRACWGLFLLLLSFGVYSILYVTDYIVAKRLRKNGVHDGISALPHSRF